MTIISLDGVSDRAAELAYPSNGPTSYVFAAVTSRDLVDAKVHTSEFGL